MATDYLPFDNYKIIEQVPSDIDSEHIRDKVVGIKCPKCKERIPVPEPPLCSGFGEACVCDYCKLIIQRTSYGMLRCDTESAYEKITKQEINGLHKQHRKDFMESLKELFSSWRK